MPCFVNIDYHNKHGKTTNKFFPPRYSAVNKWKMKKKNRITADCLIWIIRFEARCVDPEGEMQKKNNNKEGEL